MVDAECDLIVIDTAHGHNRDVARAVERYAGRYRQPRENPERVALRITVSRFLFGPGLLRG